MTVEIGPTSELNDSFSDLSLLKPTSAASRTSSSGSSSVDKSHFHGSVHTTTTVECSESSWMGDLDGSSSSVLPLMAASPKGRASKKPNVGLKSLAEAPDLDADNDFSSSSTQDDEDASIKEILEAYLAKKATEEEEEEPTRKPSAVRIPARRPKLFRTPTPDPDGLYMEIRRNPRRYRRTTPQQVAAATRLQGAVRDWLARESKRALPTKTDSDDNLRHLCRNKSFEGIMENFMKTAAPKRAAPRRTEEVVMEPMRGTLGASRSFDQNDFAQALGQSAVRRGGRRPQR